MERAGNENGIRFGSSEFECVCDRRSDGVLGCRSNGREDLSEDCRISRTLAANYWQDNVVADRRQRFADSAKILVAQNRNAIARFGRVARLI